MAKVKQRRVTEAAARSEKQHMSNRHNTDGQQQQVESAPDRGGEPGRGQDSVEHAADNFGTCAVCRSALAANGHCPDCGGPGEEPEGLDDYNFSEEGSSRHASSDSATGSQPETPESVADRASPVAGATVPRMTLVELWVEGADHHQGLTPERALDLIELISTVSADRGEARPPRLDWLKQVAEGAKPKT